MLINLVCQDTGFLALIGFLVHEGDYRPVAQLAERRSPKPKVGGSMPSWPAKQGLW